MTEEVSMFDSIINRIAERSETIRTLRANERGFQLALAAVLGDAAPEDSTEAAGFVAGVESLQMQLVGARKQTQDDTNRIADLTSQRAAAYDAERAATKRADDLLAEQQLIAEKLGLLETDDEPAGMTDSPIGRVEPVMLDAHPEVAGMETIGRCRHEYQSGNRYQLGGSRISLADNGHPRCYAGRHQPRRADGQRGCGRS